MSKTLIQFLKSKINYFHYRSKLYYAAFGTTAPHIQYTWHTFTKSNRREHLDIISEANVRKMSQLFGHDMIYMIDWIF